MSDPQGQEAPKPRVSDPQNASGPQGASRAPRPAEVARDRARELETEIRRRARTVRARDLASRLEHVQVLGMGTVRRLIEEAVEEAAERFQTLFREETRRRLLEEAEEVFQERLRAFRAEREGLEARTRLLEEELSSARRLLEEERRKVIEANQFTVSDAGMLEIEKRLERMLERVLARKSVPPSLEADMRAVLVRLLDDERDKIRRKAEEAQSRSVSLLERKVARLAQELSRAREERDRERRRAEALEEAGGIVGLKSVYRPGIAEDDPARERKLNLMKEIFEANRRIREEVAAPCR